MIKTPFTTCKKCLCGFPVDIQLWFQLEDRVTYAWLYSHVVIIGLLNECCFFFYLPLSLYLCFFLFFFSPDCFLLFPQANYNYNASSSASHPYYNQETESYTHMYPTSATGVVQGQGSQADQTQLDLEKVLNKQYIAKGPWCTLYLMFLFLMELWNRSNVV